MTTPDIQAVCEEMTAILHNELPYYLKPSECRAIARKLLQAPALLSYARRAGKMEEALRELMYVTSHLSTDIATEDYEARYDAAYLKAEAALPPAEQERKRE